MCKCCCGCSAKSIVVVSPVIDENGNYKVEKRTAEPIPTAELREFWRKCEDANDEAAGFPGNWAEVRKAMR
jgi:hypothetical protein